MEAPQHDLTRNIFPILASTLLALAGCHSLAERFEIRVGEELAAQPLQPTRVVTEADAAHLPPPVRRYLGRTGAYGRPQVQRFRVTMDAEMRRQPGGDPLPGRVVQYSFLGDPARLFYMRSRMFGLPVQVFHDYGRARARMQVRVASLVDVNDVSGPEMDVGETVTVLNDVCLMAPSLLVDPRFSWEPIDDRSARVIFRNGPQRVTATLLFDAAGDLANFVSEERAALLPDGTLKRYPWSTPVSGWQERDGRRFPARGSAVYRYPEGDFVYGVFTIRSIDYQPTEFRMQ